MCTTNANAESKLLESYYYFSNGTFSRPKVLGGITNSVSFRQGTNVEFEGPSFVEGGNGVPPKVSKCEFKYFKFYETFFAGGRTRHGRGGHD